MTGTAGLRALLALAAMSPRVAPPLLAAQAKPQTIDFSADDSARTTWLRENGRRVTGKLVVLWAPRDSISEDSLRTVHRQVEAGLVAAQQLIGAPLPWQRLGSRPVQFYLAPGRFVSHASGADAVFISFWRVGAGKAPYLHEALHEMLTGPRPFSWWEFPDSTDQRRRAAADPLWFTEGMPDYLAQRAARMAGVVEGDIFDVGDFARVDSVCAARVRASPTGLDLLGTIGGAGRPAALFTTERAKVAPVFYPCAHSFSAFLVDRIGVAAAVGLFPDLPREWKARLAALAGPLDRLRLEWLRAVGLGT